MPFPPDPDSAVMLSSIVQGTPIATFVLDTEHRVTHWNRACEQIVGIGAAEVLGTREAWRAFYDSPRPLMADLILDRSHEELAARRTGKLRPSQHVPGAIEAEAYFPRFRRWLRATAAPLFDATGRVIGAIETVEDVTERRQSEEVLSEARRQAEAAARAKAEFLANVSHEIRTPMNAVIGLAHLLQKSELSAKQREQVGRIHSAGKMLLGLINDILDFSKIEAGRMTLEETSFKLDDCLDGLATVLLSQAQAKGLEMIYVVEPDVPPQLIGDPLRLSQILVNLVGNALKFTARGGVTLFIRVAARQDERILLECTVQDTGVGMSEEQQRGLFDAFTQADTSITRKYGGTGLGLTICKRLVEMMGGEIWLSSEPDIGSTFSFTAWFGTATAPPAEMPPARGRALVVDDNTLASMVLSRFLQQAGYKVTVATSGREALEIIGSDGRFDCVAMDYLLPDFDGLALAQAIRRLPVPPPRLAMVTAADTSTLDRSPGFGEFDEILHKPVTAANVMRMAQRLSGVISVGSAMQKQAQRLIGMRILLAEDIPTNQFIAREILESFGIAVDVAGSGREALTLLEKHLYDVVLMDIQMPEMDGIEATRRIRSQARWLELPVIAMTAHALDEERLRCLEAGMNDFLTKPIDPDRLQETLARWRGEAEPAPESLPEAPAAPEKVDIPVLPGIDTAEGLRRMMNKPRLYERVLRDFYQRFRDEVSHIGKCLAVDDLETALRRAHTVKGLAGSIGALELQTAALALEEAIRSRPVRLDDETARFAAALDEVIAGLAAAYKL